MYIESSGKIISEIWTNRVTRGLHTRTSKRWFSSLKDSRQQDQSQMRTGLEARVGSARLPGNPLEFLKSLLSAGRIGLRVCGGTS